MNRKLERDSSLEDAFSTESGFYTGEDRAETSWYSRDTRMLHIRQLAEKLATVDVPVLITGESGTGKEVISRYIHERSMRRSRPFIAVNCADMSGLRQPLI